MAEDINEASQSAIDIVYHQASSDNEGGNGNSINDSLLYPQSQVRHQAFSSRRLSEDSDYCSHNTSRSSLCYSLSHQGSSASLRSIESGVYSMPPSMPEENAQANHVVSILDHPELTVDPGAVVKGMTILKLTESESAHTATDSPVHIQKRAQDQASASDSRSQILSTIKETDEGTVGRESTENEKYPPVSDHKQCRTTRSLYLKTDSEGGKRFKQRKFRKCKTQPIRTQICESEDDVPYIPCTVSINKPTGCGQEAITPEDDTCAASAIRPGLATSTSEVATHRSSVCSYHQELQPGPPEVLEVCALSQRLMILEDNWILLAQHLGMEQCEISEVKEDERTLYGKIHRVLTQWVQKSAVNNRRKLADILDSMPFNLTRIAQETLKEAHYEYC